MDMYQYTNETDTYQLTRPNQPPVLERRPHRLMAGEGRQEASILPSPNARPRRLRVDHGKGMGEESISTEKDLAFVHENFPRFTRARPPGSALTQHGCGGSRKGMNQSGLSGF